MKAYFGSKISPNITRTNNGFLVALNVPIARTGWYQYRADELGLNGTDVVDVYRDPDEVFSPAAMASFEGVPVCNDHPPEGVDPKNASTYTKGATSNVRRGKGDDEDLLFADLIIYDEELIKAIENGKREVSLGYECDYVPNDDGSYSQKDIRGNHCAVVESGRAGDRVRINDSIMTDALSEELQKKVDSGGAHWVTVKSGPLEGRHLLIEGSRPSGGQSKGKILAGHGIPNHVLQKISGGVTHASQVEHEQSEGPGRDKYVLNRMGHGEFHINRGESVLMHMGNNKPMAKVKVIGISHTNNQIHIDFTNGEKKGAKGMWVHPGQLYPLDYQNSRRNEENPTVKSTESPQNSNKQKSVSSIIERINKKNEPPGGWSESDLVPQEWRKPSGQLSVQSSPPVSEPKTKRLEKAESRMQKAEAELEAAKKRFDEVVPGGAHVQGWYTAQRRQSSSGQAAQERYNRAMQEHKAAKQELEESQFNSSQKNAAEAKRNKPEVEKVQSQLQKRQSQLESLHSHGNHSMDDFLNKEIKSLTRKLTKLQSQDSSGNQSFDSDHDIQSTHTKARYSRMSEIKLPTRKPGSVTRLLAAVGLKHYAMDAEPEDVMDAVDAMAEEHSQHSGNDFPVPTGQPGEGGSAKVGDDEGDQDAIAKLSAQVAQLTELVHKLAQPAQDPDPEQALDAEIERLSKEDKDDDDDESKTIEAQDDDGPVSDPEDRPQSALKAADSAAEFLKAMKPAIAAIKDPIEKKRVVDAALKAVKGRTARPSQTYQKLTKPAKTADTAPPAADPSELGKKIMAAHNPHYKNRV